MAQVNPPLPRLLRAALENALPRVQFALGREANIEGRDGDGRTALIFASREGHLPVVKRLLEEGADVNATKEDGLNSLILASQNGHLECVRLLLHRGANVNVCAAGFSAVTALHQASRHGRHEVVRVLCTLGADVHACNDSDFTPLMCACQGGHVEVVRELCEWGANVNFSDHDTDSPLSIASSLGHLDIVRALCDRGADVSYDRGSGKPKYLALKRAIEEGHLHIVQELYQRGANLHFVWLQRLHITPLYLACILGNIDIINWLCKKGCDSTAVIMNSFRNSPHSTKLVPEASYRELLFWVMIGKNGNNALPPLFNACNDGMTEVVHDLCVKGENVNATMPFTGATALMWASRGGHLEIVRKLCDNGANLVAVMKEPGFSALFIACLCGHTEVVRELCCRGVQIPPAILTWAVRFNKLDIVQELCRRDKLDVNCSSKHGYSALMAAVENCNLAIFRELCNKGARINDQDKYGTTALMIAVQNFDSEDENNGQLQEIIMELCDRGADLNLCDKRGKTALMWAFEHGESEEVLQMISSLCDKGANVDACGTNGITPLMIACDRRAHKTVEELLARGANVNAVSGLMRASVFFCKGSGFLRKRPLPRAGWLSFKSALTWRSFSALDFACRSKSLEIAALLLTAGAIKTPGVRETFKVCCEGIICAEGEGGSPVWRRLFQYSRMETRPYTGLWSCFSPKARVVPL